MMAPWVSSLLEGIHYNRHLGGDLAVLAAWEHGMSELLGTLAYNGFILAVAKAYSWGQDWQGKLGHNGCMGTPRQCFRSH